MPPAQERVRTRISTLTTAQLRKFLDQHSQQYAPDAARAELVALAQQHADTLSRTELDELSPSTKPRSGPLAVEEATAAPVEAPAAARAVSAAPALIRWQLVVVVAAIAMGLFLLPFGYLLFKLPPAPPLQPPPPPPPSLPVPWWSKLHTKLRGAKLKVKMPGPGRRRRGDS